MFLSRGAGGRHSPSLPLASWCRRAHILGVGEQLWQLKSPLCVESDAMQLPASASFTHATRLTHRLGGRGSITFSEGGAEAKGVLLAFLGTRFLALALLLWVRRSSGRGCLSFRRKPLISQACLIVVPPPRPLSQQSSFPP